MFLALVCFNVEPDQMENVDFENTNAVQGDWKDSLILINTLNF